MSGARPWMIALAASAAVNVFLIGGLAGMTYVRLTTPAPVVSAPAAPVAPARPAVVVANPPPVVQPPAPATPVSAPPRPPAHHVKAPPPPVVEDPPPPPVAAPPVAAAATPVRPPLISAGDSLSPDSRRAFRRALNEANKRNKPLTQQARDERQAALSALGAPGYDAGEVSRRLASARALDQQARANVEAALAAFTATLSPQERAALADGLARVYAPLAARRAMAGPN
jgi:uncharacterized membrane protein